MKVTGIQKLTLLDYPGVVACTVFTAGCNFRCPFCHNAMLVLPEQIDDECLTDDEVFGFLKKRRGVLDGVGVTSRFCRSGRRAAAACGHARVFGSCEGAGV